MKRYWMNLIKTVKIEPNNLENIFCDIHPLQGKSQKMLGHFPNQKIYSFIFCIKKEMFLGLL